MAQTDPDEYALFDVSLARVGFVVHRAPDPAWKVAGRTRRTLWVMAYAMDGKVHYRFDGARRLTVQRDGFVWLPPGMRREGRSDAESPWDFFSMGFALHGSDAALARLASLPNTAAARQPDQVCALLAELQRHWAGREPDRMLMCRSLLLQLLSHFIRAAAPDVPPRVPPRRHERILRVAAVLQERYAEDWPVEQLAAMAGLGVTRFRILFRRVTGRSPVKYLNALRLDRARDLLLSGECNVTEAARRTGFTDVFYFSRLYRRTLGVNPSEDRG